MLHPTASAATMAQAFMPSWKMLLLLVAGLIFLLVVFILWNIYQILSKITTTSKDKPTFTILIILTKIFLFWSPESASSGFSLNYSTSVSDFDHGFIIHLSQLFDFGFVPLNTVFCPSFSIIRLRIYDLDHGFIIRLFQLFGFGFVLLNTVLLSIFLNYSASDLSCPSRFY